MIAFYLPQFHPVPENDEWWGPGFTEWTNVAAARPSYRGHRQPRLPGELGFYDLRLPETRAAQARLAAKHEIDGFCYWHYWFGGRRILERPFAEEIDLGGSDLPVCLAWANESWTRTWLGSGEVLLEQTYSAEDDEHHCEWLAEAFTADRYLRIDGRPLLLVYRPADHPNPRRFLELLAAASASRGVPRPLAMGMNGWDPRVDCRDLGFDGTVDFQPQLGDLAGAASTFPSVTRRVLNLAHGRVRRWPEVHSYKTAYRRMVARRLGLGFPTVATIFVGWDNTARRGRHAVVMSEPEPEGLRDAIADHLVAASVAPPTERFVMLNAWNEWAEGNYLEPDSERGRAFLEAVRDARALAEHRLAARRGQAGATEPAPRGTPAKRASR